MRNEREEEDAVIETETGGQMEEDWIRMREMGSQRAYFDRRWRAGGGQVQHQLKQAQHVHSVMLWHQKIFRLKRAPCFTIWWKKQLWMTADLWSINVALHLDRCCWCMSIIFRNINIVRLFSWRLLCSSLFMKWRTLGAARLVLKVQKISVTSVKSKHLPENSGKWAEEVGQVRDTERMWIEKRLEEAAR